MAMRVMSPGSSATSPRSNLLLPLQLRAISRQGPTARIRRPYISTRVSIGAAPGTTTRRGAAFVLNSEYSLPTPVRNTTEHTTQAACNPVPLPRELGWVPSPHVQFTLPHREASWRRLQFSGVPDAWPFMFAGRFGESCCRSSCSLCRWRLLQILIMIFPKQFRRPRGRRDGSQPNFLLPPARRVCHSRR